VFTRVVDNDPGELPDVVVTTAVEDGAGRSMLAVSHRYRAGDLASASVGCLAVLPLTGLAPGAYALRVTASGPEGPVASRAVVIDIR
jgi:hypothetical protein